MPSELNNLLITIPFIIFLVLMFFWLVKALMPSSRELAAKYTKDKYELAGYETINDIKRKEYTVIGGGIVVLVFCLGIMGGLAYLVFSAGASAAFEDQMGLNLLLVFIPALVLMGFIIAGSVNYMKRQQVILHEFRTFRAVRERAIKEYQEKRSGKEKEQGEAGQKKESGGKHPAAKSGAAKGSEKKPAKKRTPKLRS